MKRERERDAIPINVSTVVNEMNIFMICEKSVEYCGEDATVDTVMDQDRILVYMTERGGDFIVKHGDTWAQCGILHDPRGLLVVDRLNRFPSKKLLYSFLIAEVDDVGPHLDDLAPWD